MRQPIADAVGKHVVLNYNNKELAGILTNVAQIQKRSGVYHYGYIHTLGKGEVLYFEVPYDTSVKLLTEEEEENLYKKIDTVEVIRKMPTDYMSVGCDPEIFAVNGRGTIIPAFTFLPDKKKRQGNDPFWDGFQAEFTTNPNTCLAFQVDDIRRGLNQIRKSLLGKNKKAKLTYKSVLDIPTSIMAKASQEHTALGCAPSMNAYVGIEALNVINPADLPTRFAGFHMHFGRAFKGDKDVVNAVKMIDAITGVMSVLLLQGLEDSRRRIFYGRAGEYRIPKHGLEYRTISSGILLHPVLVHLCFDTARLAIAMSKNQRLYRRLWKASEEEVIDTINTYNVKQAKDIIGRNKSILKALLSRLYENTGGDTKVNHIFDLIWFGARRYFEPNGLEDHWKLKTATGWIDHSDAIGCNVRSWSEYGKRLPIKEKAKLVRIDENIQA